MGKISLFGTTLLCVIFFLLLWLVYSVRYRFNPLTVPVDADADDYAIVWAKRAIAGYLDSEPHFVDELLWAHSSLEWSGAVGASITDFIIFYNPLVEQLLPDFCVTRIHAYSDFLKHFNNISRSNSGNNRTALHRRTSRCFAFPMSTHPLTIKHQYLYLNSLAFLTMPLAIQVLRNYDFVLKTDLDVFFTPRFRNWFPTDIYIGKGAYVWDDLTRDNLLRISDKLGLRNQKQNNLGATWYGPRAIVLKLAELATNLTVYILENEFTSGHGKWPSWYRGVASMYGSELALNHLVDKTGWKMEALDGDCTGGQTCNYAHIHAWHSLAMFSKHAYWGKEYDGKDVDQLSLHTTDNYACYIALKSTKRDKTNGANVRPWPTLCKNSPQLQ